MSQAIQTDSNTSVMHVQAIQTEIRHHGLNRSQHQSQHQHSSGLETGFDLRFGGLGENQVGPSVSRPHTACPVTEAIASSQQPSQEKVSSSKHPGIWSAHCRGCRRPVFENVCRTLVTKCSLRSSSQWHRSSTQC